MNPGYLILATNLKRSLLVLALAAVPVACGESPLAAVGEKSAEWINEPEVVTTTVPVVTVPVVIGAESLLWANDEIVSENLGNADALLSEVFARREGDRFIQASRVEISTILPDLIFPSSAPYGAEWVSSQLVIENSGLLSDDPVAAFGIWSAEPYSRSRSVAQLAVLRVIADAETAVQIEQSGELPSCARFAETTTEGCNQFEINDRTVWALSSQQGATLIWFDGPYRYELFGRPFISFDALTEMAGSSLRLGDLVPARG